MEEPSSKRTKYSKYKVDLFYVKLRSGLEFYFTQTDGDDLLVPLHEESDPFIRMFVSSIPISIKARLLYLSNFTSTPDMVQSDLLNEVVDSNPAVQLPCLRQRIFATYLKEIKLRNAFRKLVQRWRIRKMDQRFVPTDDPITLEPPTKPVYVYDWSNRTKFVFDARSLSTYLESKLLYHSGGFSMPIYPRNPWTNMRWNDAQLVSIFQQLKAYGEVRWAFLTFRQHQFHETTWRMYQGSSLTMNAIRNSLLTLDSDETRELLEDFLITIMDDLGFTINDSILSAYRAAMQHDSHHWYLQECKKLAILDYESIHFHLNRRRWIMDACKRLFSRQPVFFLDLYQKKLIKQLPSFL